MKLAQDQLLIDKEVSSFLAKHGFETVQAESLSISEQARLFAEAKIVLGPHGAGFTNIAFCKPGTKVVELYCNRIEPTFWNTCVLHGLEHYIHKFDEGKPKSQMPVSEAELNVSLEELQSLLDFVAS